jgi:D-glycero-D-manno-heptose 1,7-bisphosphate phosphatase
LGSIYICPDFDGNVVYIISSENIEHWVRTSLEQPSFRKPDIGMILRAIEDLGKPLGEGWMIGELPEAAALRYRPEDQQCAAKAGLNFLWADIWRQRFFTGSYQIEKVEPIG